MTRARRAPVAGFTLMELMLAVSLLGLILVMLYNSFSAVSRSKTHGEHRLETDQAGRAVLWQLSKELRGVVQTQLAPSHVMLIGQGGVERGAAMDAISFSTLDVGHRRALNGFGAEETVAYASAPNPNHRGWYLLIRTQRSSLLQQATGAFQTPTTVLADNVLAFHLRYFDGLRWVESWNTQVAPPGQQLPVAISMELTMAAPGGRPVTFSTQLAVPMALLQR